MKRLYSLPGIILSIVFLAFAYFMISKSTHESAQFKADKNEIIQILNFNDRLLSFRDWVFSEAAWEEKRVKFEEVVKNAEVHYANAKLYGHYILIGCLIFLVTVVAIYAKRRKFFGLTLAFSVIGFALIGQGVMSPMLEISAFKEDLTIKVYVKPSDIPYFEEAVAYLEDVSEFTKDIATYIEYIPFIGEDIAESAEELIDDGAKYLTDHSDDQIGFDKVFPGYTYFYYQNKGIMDVIALLWTSGNKPVAAAIGTFSIIIPLIKLMFTLIILLLPIKGWKSFRKFLSYLSKWSMADVFVVGAFLSYLSFANMSPGVEMDAKALFGLYYFGGYVLISIVLGYLLDASMKEKEKLSNQNTDVPKIS